MDEGGVCKKSPPSLRKTRGEVEGGPGVGRVCRLMRGSGLAGVTPKWKFRVLLASRGTPAENKLNRGFEPTGAHGRWWGDITVVGIWEGPAYIATVICLNGCEVLGLEESSKMDATLIENALLKAVKNVGYAGEVMFHSDRGSQCPSAQCARLCSRNNIIRSNSLVANCCDNAVAESFFASLNKGVRSPAALEERGKCC